DFIQLLEAQSGPDSSVGGSHRRLLFFKDLRRASSPLSRFLKLLPLPQQLRETEIRRGDRNFVAFVDKEFTGLRKGRLCFGVVHEFDLSNALDRQRKRRLIPVTEFLKCFKGSTSNGRSVLEQVQLRVKVGAINVT